MSLANHDSRSPKRRRLHNESNHTTYQGFVFPQDGRTTAGIELDRVDPRTTNAQDFFTKYVSARKPCILTQASSFHLVKNISPSDVLRHAGSVKVQVEKRQSKEEFFGQNRTKERQVVMTIRELFGLWKGPDRELYYLSTQRYDDDDSGPFLGPCEALKKQGLLQPTFSLAGNLKLESCNLWMGAANNKSCSGLHHDFHDNFYFMLQGSKEFRLYAPSDYTRIPTFGVVDRIHSNGLISYKSSRPIGSDGELNDEEEEEEDEEVILGQGFDYKSESDDEEQPVFDEDGEDDYDNLVQEDDADDDDSGGAGDTTRPNSFSPINPTLDKEKLKKEYPDFLECTECLVELKAGEALYLPASWFHCVESKTPEASGSSEPHMAINYWYFPPDQLDSFEAPYRNDDCTVSSEKET